MSWKISTIVPRILRIAQVESREIKDVVSVTSEAVEPALERYSRDHFREKTKDYSTTSDNKKIFDLPSDFDLRFSAIMGIELPVGDNPPKMLEKKQYRIYKNDLVTPQLFLVDTAIAVNQTFRLWYSVNQEITTIPAQHKQAFAYLAAAELCEAIDAGLIRLQSSTLETDTQSGATRASSWARKADRFMKKYVRVVGPIPEEEVQAACVDTDVSTLFAGTRARVYRRP